MNWWWGKLLAVSKINDLQKKVKQSRPSGFAPGSGFAECQYAFSLLNVYLQQKANKIKIFGLQWGGIGWCDGASVWKKMHLWHAMGWSGSSETTPY